MVTPILEQSSMQHMVQRPKVGGMRRSGRCKSAGTLPIRITGAALHWMEMAMHLAGSVTRNTLAASVIHPLTV